MPRYDFIKQKIVHYDKWKDDSVADPFDDTLVARNLDKNFYELAKGNSQVLKFAEEIQEIVDGDCVAVLPCSTLRELSVTLLFQSAASRVAIESELRGHGWWLGLVLCSLTHCSVQWSVSDGFLRFQKSLYGDKFLFGPNVREVKLPNERYSTLLAKEVADEIENLRPSGNRKNNTTHATVRVRDTKGDGSETGWLFDVHPSGA